MTGFIIIIIIYRMEIELFSCKTIAFNGFGASSSD